MATGSASEGNPSKSLLPSICFDLQEIDEIPELVDLKTPKTAKVANSIANIQQMKSLKQISMKNWPKRSKEHFDSGDYFCEKEISKEMEDRSPKTLVGLLNVTADSPNSQAFTRRSQLPSNASTPSTLKFEFTSISFESQSSLSERPQKN